MDLKDKIEINELLRDLNMIAFYLNDTANLDCCPFKIHNDLMEEKQQLLDDIELLGKLIYGGNNG